MELKINNKSIEIINISSVFDKFKGLKFVLEPIEEIYRFKSKYANTYFLCQKVDIIMTDKEQNILFIYKKVKSEKIILPKKKVYYTYFLPVGISDNFKIGDRLNIKDDSK